jgi:DNA-3-methyladenine glycosylase I
VLLRRDGYRQAFHNFDVLRVAEMTTDDVERLLEDTSIIRHRGKVESTISNAQAVLEIQREAGSLDALLWSFVDGAPRRKEFRALTDLPAQTEESKAMSKELKRRGLRFVGPTICYAFMQSAGLINDHTIDCFRYDEV